mmetsp:Transcript_9371/g.30182  ORF Transcript_9371/g.30182 Transcript_9371/m.30182 type:complete len:245 (-) Transcript_9371:208-942(-)
MCMCTVAQRGPLYVSWICAAWHAEHVYKALKVGVTCVTLTLTAREKAERERALSADYPAHQTDLRLSSRSRSVCSERIASVRSRTAAAQHLSSSRSASSPPLSVRRPARRTTVSQSGVARQATPKARRDTHPWCACTVRSYATRVCAASEPSPSPVRAACCMARACCSKVSAHMARPRRTQSRPMAPEGSASTPPRPWISAATSAASSAFMLSCRRRGDARSHFRRASSMRSRLRRTSETEGPM